MLVSRPPRSPVVAMFVSSYWYCELDIDHHTEIVFPSAQCQIVIGLHPTAEPMSVLVGPSTKPTLLDATQQRRAVGVNLQAGAASSLSRENAQNLLNENISLEALWGPQASSLVDRLRNIAEPERLFDELDIALLSQLDGRKQIDSNVAAAKAAIHLGVATGDIPSLLQTDRRRLARSFTQTVGLGLKSYSRLCRFQAAVSDIRGPSTESLSMIAASLGYADQAHLTREVKEYSGETPGLLRSKPSTSPNHLIVPDPL